MRALAHPAPSRTTVEDFLDWPGDRKIGEDRALLLEGVDFSCRLATIYEGMHLARTRPDLRP